MIIILYDGAVSFEVKIFDRKKVGVDIFDGI